MVGIDIVHATKQSKVGCVGSYSSPTPTQGEPTVWLGSGVNWSAVVLGGLSNAPIHKINW